MTKKKIVEKHSPDLRLEGVISDLVKNIKILKGIEMPPGRGYYGGSGKWDHLIARLTTGDCIELDHKSAAAFANRGRNLGYVIVLRKIDEEVTRVWFEGFNQNPPSVKKG